MCELMFLAGCEAGEQKPHRVRNADKNEPGIHGAVQSSISPSAVSGTRSQGQE